MSAVVLRCPNCGTTQTGPGECEACHEAEVRPFCTNHTPGRWLDGAQCDACGARLGDPGPPPPRPAPRPAAAAPSRAAPLPPGPASPRSPAGSARRDIPVGRRTPPAATPPVPPRAPAPAPRPAPRPDTYAADDAPPPRVGRRPATFPEIPGFPGFPGLPRRRGGPGVAVPPGLPDVVRVGTRSAAGCFVRAVVTLVVLAALLAAGLFGLLGMGGGARGWVVDLGQQVGVVEGVPAQTERGVAAYRAGDRALAERELAEAARLYPRSAVAPLYLARLRFDAGDDYRAREHLAEALRREPESPLVRRTVAEYGCAIAARAPAGGGSAAELAARAGAACPPGA